MHTFPEYAPRGDAQVAELARHNPFGVVISADHGVADRYRMLISSGAATWARSSSAPPSPLPPRRREAEPSRACALAGHLRPGPYARNEQRLREIADSVPLGETRREDR